MDLLMLFFIAAGMVGFGLLAGAAGRCPSCGASL